MIPENFMQRHDSKQFMTIEVRHSDTLASLRDEENTFLSGTSTISTRSGLQHINVAPNGRRIRRQESLTASTIVEKSPADSYEQPQPVPQGKTAMVLPLEGRPVLQLEDEDVTIKMLKTMHAQLERELQEKKERSERKKRMKQMIREEKERERRASQTKSSSKRRGPDEKVEVYSREQEMRDLQLIQEKLREQRWIEQEIAAQIKRENKRNRDRSVRDDRRHVVPVNELIHGSNKRPPFHYEASPQRVKLNTEKSTQRFSSDPKRSPVSRSAPRPPARHMSPEDVEPIVLVKQQLAQMSMGTSQYKPTGGSSLPPVEPINMTRQDYVPSEEDTALCTFAESYSSLDPRPFCSAVDSVKLARGEFIMSSEEDDTFVDSWEKPPEMKRKPSKTSPTNSDRKPALPNRAASFGDSFSLLSFDSNQR